MSDLLLDTHTLLWWATGDPRLTLTTRGRIQRSDAVYVSAATAWEIRTKYRLGKLPDAEPFVSNLAGEIAAEGFRDLPVTFADGDLAGALGGDHKDPFDRMLIAQALNHRLAIVSNETAFDWYGVVRVW